MKFKINTITLKKKEKKEKGRKKEGRKKKRERKEDLDLHGENITTNEINPRPKQIATPCSQIRRLIAVSMSIRPNFIYRFNGILIKLNTSLGDSNKLILKFLWKTKEP